MNEEEYTHQLFEIMKSMTKKLGSLQQELTMEELIKYQPIMNFFFVNLIEQAVGKDDLVSYMIQLLSMADHSAKDSDEVKERQIKRYKDVFEKNKESLED